MFWRSECTERMFSPEVGGEGGCREVGGEAGEGADSRAEGEVETVADNWVKCQVSSLKGGVSPPSVSPSSRTGWTGTKNPGLRVETVSCPGCEVSGWELFLLRLISSEVSSRVSPVCITTSPQLQVAAQCRLYLYKASDKSYISRFRLLSNWLTV